jgi:hypothetical protein
MLNGLSEDTGMQAITIDRSKFNQNFVSQFKGKHYFALSLLIGNEKYSRQTGINETGEPTYIFQSAKQAHRQFDWYNPGQWYNAPLGEKVLEVLLVREDGKTWHKAGSEQTTTQGEQP